MSIDKVIQMYDGFHFEGELRMLNRIAAGVTEGVIVAIGSFRGQSDCALALHATVPVYTIDHREGSVGDDYQFGEEDRTVWMQNVLNMGLGVKIRPINLDSMQVAQVWNLPVGLLFVDGSHDYESVMGDLTAWLPHMIDGGLVAMHDNNKPGVMQATEEWLGSAEVVEIADITTVYRLDEWKEMPQPSEAKADAMTLSIMGPGNIVLPSPPNVLVEGVSSPRHPSQKPKTPTKTAAKKKTGRR